MVRFTSAYRKVFLTFFCFLWVGSAMAHAANVALGWDPNNPAPEGYRVFMRQKGQGYDYSQPTWEGRATTCTLTGLVEEVTYFFVVRAYDGDLESADSNEVSYTPKSSRVDSDNDSIPDALDAFPHDPSEWADNDGDGVGNNQDTDDDNDGMSDAWEAANGLNPHIDDADLDADNDGLTNYEEFLAESQPWNNPDNTLPDTPQIDDVQATEQVGLTPVLVAGGYFDPDDDGHKQTRWQISTENDFAELVLDAISSSQLSTYCVGEMLLDPDTQYFWRVQFIDARQGASQWSQTGAFTTVGAVDAGDADANGILDQQEVAAAFDVDGDGVADLSENDMMTLQTVEGGVVVGVESLSDHAFLVSAKSITCRQIPDQSVQTESGLIGFKLYLEEGVTTAAIRLHFSRPVGPRSKMYKYLAESGWTVYRDAVFAENGKSVTLVLEDGGAGDEDGVQNGVIVDPAGIADPDSSLAGASDPADAANGGGGCFLSTADQSLWVRATATPTAPVLICLLLAARVIWLLRNRRARR